MDVDNKDSKMKKISNFIEMCPLLNNRKNRSRLFE